MSISRRREGGRRIDGCDGLVLKVKEEGLCKGLLGVHSASKDEDLGGIEKGCCVMHATLEFEGGIERLEGDPFDLLGGKGETKDV